ncbi:hypothetical protein D3C87_85060 [compost metagenome]
MYAGKQLSKTHATNLVRQKKQARGGASHFPDNRPEAFLLKKMRQTMEDHAPVLQKSENKTGLPDKLKSGMENLSGYALDDVKVHYNSEKPAQLQAHAYAQGSDIHLAPGQEKHLPHEAWHVVQQKQGRVKSTRQMKGQVNVNDDVGLEKEADVMGAKSLELNAQISEGKPLSDGNSSAEVVQQMPDWMLKLIAMAMENKYVAGGTALGAAGVLLYYYCKKNPGMVPPQIEEEVAEAPNYEALQNLASVLRIDTGVLVSQLETGLGDIDVVDFYQKGLGTDIVDTLIPPKLLYNLPEEASAKLDELIRRFHDLRFKYTGEHNRSATGYLTRTGDCYTLSDMFLHATIAAGIEGVTIHDVNQLMLVPSAPIHGRNALGNVHGQLYWAFESHYWCEYEGTTYDLLFMKNKKPDAFYQISENRYKGITYFVFENGCAMIKENMYGNLKAKLSANHIGYVAKSEYAVKRFIDTNKIK